MPKQMRIDPFSIPAAAAYWWMIYRARRVEYGRSRFDSNKNTARRSRCPWIHVAASAPGTGFIDRNSPDGTPVALSVSLLHIMHQDSPQTSIVLIE